jgi:hypothetical protein
VSAPVNPVPTVTATRSAPASDTSVPIAEALAIG